MAEWDESKHPRAEDGKFGEGNGTAASAPPKERSPRATAAARKVRARGRAPTKPERFNAKPHERQIAKHRTQEAKLRRASIALKAKMAALKAEARAKAKTPAQKARYQARFEKLAAKRDELRGKADAAKASRVDARRSLTAARNEHAAQRKAARDAAASERRKARDGKKAMGEYRSMLSRSVSTTPEVSVALRAIDTTKREPIASTPHPNSSTAEFVKQYGDDELRSQRTSVENTLRKVTGKKITYDELTHGFAVPDRFELRLNEMGGDGKSARVRWDIYDKATGEKAGTLIREFGRDKNGPYVSHSVLNVNSKLRGNGISDAINGNALRHYEKWGIKTAKVEAISAGRYAWARLGFRFDDPPAVLEKFKEFVRQQPELRGREAELTKVAEKLVLEPWKLAKWDAGVQLTDAYNSAPERQGAAAPKVPLGKAFLLSKESDAWAGSMRIDKNDEGFRTAIRKAAVAPRAK